MRILVIGGNGFIGTPLVTQLRGAGHRVAVLHRGAGGGVPGSDVVSIRGDQNRLADCRSEIQEFLPDAVVALVLSSGEQARQLMSEASVWTRRVVAVSSMDVYRAWGILRELEPGPPEPLPIAEESPVRTVRQLYSSETLRTMRSIFSWLDDDYDKIAVEEAVMGDSAVAGTVLRLPMVYGPGDRLHRFFPLLKRIADRRPFVLMADDLAAWCGPRGYVEDVAHAIALAATSDRAAGSVYNVCQEPALSDLAWQKRIAETLGWKGRFVVLPREQTPRHLLQPGNPAQHIAASSARIRSELGFEEIVGLDEGIRRTAAWEEKNPPGRINPEEFDYEAEDAMFRDRR